MQWYHPLPSQTDHLPQFSRAVPLGVQRGRAAFFPSKRYNNLEPDLRGSAGHRLGAIFHLRFSALIGWLERWE